LITFSGFNQTVFYFLLELFTPLFDICTPYIDNGPAGSGYKKNFVTGNAEEGKGKSKPILA
jgi:hypothetical protein